MTIRHNLPLFALATLSTALLAASPAPFEQSTDAHGATRVYHNTFETAPGSEWSANQITKTPTGEHPYLGDFLPGKPVTLTLDHLPPHELVRLTFDLYIMGGWSGSSTAFGYHRWDLDLGDGRNLIHTTFCNWGGAYNNNNAQAFPDSFPARPHPGFTLATEKQSLGTTMNTQYNKPYDASSVYHLVLTFPHTDKDITFAFHSLVQEWQQKPFGLANATVDILPAQPLLTDPQLDQLWKNLGGQDPAKFFAAQWALIAAGDQAVNYIAKHVDDSIDPPPEQVLKMIDELKNADDDHRTEILETLAFQGSLASAPLRKAVADDTLPDEQKNYVEQARVTSKLYNETPTQLRLFRVKQLLGAIHTKAALELNVKLTELPARPLSTD